MNLFVPSMFHRPSENENSFFFIAVRAASGIVSDSLLLFWIPIQPAASFSRYLTKRNV